MAGWEFQGGGKAHALTMRALGYRCVDKTDQFRSMQRHGTTIFVPVDPYLRPKVIKGLVQRAAGSREEYLLAWQRKKKYKLDCP